MVDHWCVWLISNWWVRTVDKHSIIIIGRNYLKIIEILHTKRTSLIRKVFFCIGIIVIIDESDRMKKKNKRIIEENWSSKTCQQQTINTPMKDINIMHILSKETDEKKIDAHKMTWQIYNETVFFGAGSMCDILKNKLINWMKWKKMFKNHQMITSCYVI